MSPTMTEGNIASWKIKEGESFAAGDVLLEIETDKASMDVEAQDDGILAKIVVPEGSKAIAVGTRIGVIAEPGDDLSTLEIPEDESSASAPKKEETTPQPAAGKADSKEAASRTSTPASDAPAEQPKQDSSAPKKQRYPLLPSVQHLIHEHGLDASAVEKMTPSGPNGRLLKGDVLAFLGSVSSSYPTDLATRIGRLSHLDLSNIKIRTAPPAAPKPAASKPVPEPEVPRISEVALPISMAAVLEVQKRVQTTLGTSLPLSVFIARASDIANDDLPRSKFAKESADELFNQVLGLHKIGSAGARGNFMPQITALPSTAMAIMPRKASQPKSDIIDILTGKKPQVKRAVATPLPGPAVTTNIFSVTVPAGDERRAKVFLERVKLVLEQEPGSLVL